ncbi:hypothetical protein EDL98_03365 [Ornithobacterium rhinotracheale]|nr:hypothetical protein [Ornithobacterium rhinotracheale]
MEEKNKENVFWGFSLSLNFLYLEEIATPILVKNNLLGRSLQPKDVYNSFFVDFDFEIPIVNMEVVTKEDVDYIKNLFLKFYKEKALPFFEKWKDLTVLYEYIKDKTEEELWDILGQFAPMKKAVILRLCNDCNYQDFMNDYYEKQKEYYEEDPEDIDNIRYYNAAKELKEVLDKTAPIYNV